MQTLMILRWVTGSLGSKALNSGAFWGEVATPFEQGASDRAPSLKSGDDWMIDVFLGWFFEVEKQFKHVKLQKLQG